MVLAYNSLIRQIYLHICTGARYPMNVYMRIKSHHSGELLHARYDTLVHFFFHFFQVPEILSGAWSWLEASKCQARAEHAAAIHRWTHTPIGSTCGDPSLSALSCGPPVPSGGTRLVSYPVPRSVPSWREPEPADAVISALLYYYVFIVWWCMLNVWHSSRTRAVLWWWSRP